MADAKPQRELPKETETTEVTTATSRHTYRRGGWRGKEGKREEKGKGERKIEKESVRERKHIHTHTNY